MILQDFPLLKRSFREIFYESFGVAPHHRFDPGEDVPDHWVPAFKLTERVLLGLGDRTIESCSPLADKEDYGGTTTLWEVVTLPVDDDDEVVLKNEHCTEEEIETVKKVMLEFFDGDLLGVFVKEKSR